MFLVSRWADLSGAIASPKILRQKRVPGRVPRPWGGKYWFVNYSTRDGPDRQGGPGLVSEPSLTVPPSRAASRDPGVGRLTQGLRHSVNR